MPDNERQTLTDDQIIVTPVAGTPAPGSVAMLESDPDADGTDPGADADGTDPGSGGDADGGGDTSADPVPGADTSADPDADSTDRS